MLRSAFRIALMAALPMRLAAMCLARMGVISMCLLPVCVGCAMCGSQDDYTYAAFGGRWQRDDPYNGRVGSAFAPAGPMVVEEGASDDGNPQQIKDDKPQDGSESADASDAEEVQGEALSEAGDGNADEGNTEAVTNADENGNMTDISAPSNSSEPPRPSSRSVLH